MAIQVFPEFVSYNLSVETVNIGWINDRAVLRSPWSSPKYPGLQNEFLFLKGIFLLSFLFRNCVSLNPLLWLCFKNCFCQRHNAPNHHTCLCQQISESFFWSERKKRLCDKIDDIQQDINIINIKTIKSSINTCIKPKPLKKHQLIYLQNLVFIQRFLGLWMSDMLLQPLGGWGGLDCTDCRSLMAN